MKRFNSTEIGGFLLASVLFFGGLVMVIAPRETQASHPTSGRLGSGKPYFELITKRGSRIYGCFAMVFGGALAVFIFRPVRK